MHTYYALLGNHPDISLAELVGAAHALGFSCNITHEGRFAHIESQSPLPDTFFKRLGGVDRILEHVSTTNTEPNSSDILAAVASLSPSGELPIKWKLGLSSYATSHNINLKKLGIDVKKDARSRNSKLAFITPAKGTNLNTAQVLFNSLMRDSNAEISLIARQGGTWGIAKTIQIQDIESYEKRDIGRPIRDAKVGMLPPKLAQMMLNIAAGYINPADMQNKDMAILDPFCGMGTTLQEGWLMGYQMVGTDASADMVAASEKNLRWLNHAYKPNEQIPPQIRVHDIKNPFPEDWNDSIVAVVTETYLGKPRGVALSPTVAERDLGRLTKLYKYFYQNIHPLLAKNGVILAALPALVTSKGMAYLPDKFIDEIEKIGYRQVKLNGTPRGTLMYQRPDAVVARELILFQLS